MGKARTMAVTKKATQATGVDTSNDKDPLIGKQLGDYRLTSVLATGGMARIYKGMDYRISVCCEPLLGEKVNYKIFDSRTNELLFDNKSAEETQTFEFQSISTRQLIIEVMVPQGATEKEQHKATDAACVGLLIEHKITDKQGFSTY